MENFVQKKRGMTKAVYLSFFLSSSNLSFQTCVLETEIQIFHCRVRRSDKILYLDFRYNYNLNS